MVSAVLEGLPLLLPSAATLGFDCSGACVCPCAALGECSGCCAIACGECGSCGACGRRDLEWFDPSCATAAARRSDTSIPLFASGFVGGRSGCCGVRDVPVVAMTWLAAVVVVLAVSSAAVAEVSECMGTMGMEDDEETRLDTISLSSSWNALTMSESPTPCVHEFKKLVRQR